LGYIKLGRLNKRIADQIDRKPADIFIEYNYLTHIARSRYEYLQKIELNALTYVQIIIENFTEIREGRDGALLLVAHLDVDNKDNIVVIELQLIASQSIYIVKTAMPRAKFTKSEVLLWEK